MQEGQSAVGLLLDRYEAPSYRGVLPVPPAATATETNQRCGDVVTIYVAVRGDVVAAAAFQGAGCTLSQAAADIAMELAVGLPVARAARLDARAIQDFAGMAPTASRRDCLALATRALRRALGSQGAA